MSIIDEKIEELKNLQELGEIELNVLGNYTIADAIREGSMVTTQAFNWGTGENACAMSAAVLAARARGYEV